MKRDYFISVALASFNGEKYIKEQLESILVQLDENDEVIGYKFVRVGKMLEDIRHGTNPNDAYNNNIGTYGRYDDAAKYIDPREE